jgi:hypothetical protein
MTSDEHHTPFRQWVHCPACKEPFSIGTADCFDAALEHKPVTCQLCKATLMLEYEELGTNGDEDWAFVAKVAP